MGQLGNVLNNPNLCVDPGCGNGVLEINEGCDDGNLAPGDGSNNQCLLEIGQPCTLLGTCASDACDPLSGTCECDEDIDGLMNDVCDTSLDPNKCIPVGCGNGIVEATEGCDDGNTTSGDGSAAMCTKELGQPCTDGSTCESGSCDTTTSECVCDDDGDCGMGEVCNTNADPNACVTARCGNNVLETGEGCADGNTTNGDGYVAMCTKELGQTCTDPAECNSSNCDGTTKRCVCNVDGDCLKGEVCDTMANPHKCGPPAGSRSGADCTGGLFCDEPSTECVECTQGSACADQEDNKNECDVASFSCVRCVKDVHGLANGRCTIETHTCTLEAVIVEGSGGICATFSDSTNDNKMPFALLGLLALGMTVRRRRGVFVLSESGVADRSV